MIEKSQACYIFRPGLSYVCGECLMRKKKPGGHGCALMSSSASISLTAGGCNYFCPGDPDHVDPFYGMFTKRQLGYMENPEGFTCGRCEEFLPAAESCKKVERTSAGDTQGKIVYGACCNLWEPDSERAKLGDKPLIQLVTKAKAPADGQTVGLATAMGKS